MSPVSEATVESAVLQIDSVWIAGRRLAGN